MEDFPPQVLLRNIPPGYNALYIMETISNMMEEGHSKGLVDPSKIIVRNDHAFLHFDDADDAKKAQKHLNAYKLKNAIISAILLVDEEVNDSIDHELKKSKGPELSDKDFPAPPVTEKQEQSEKQEIKEMNTVPDTTILSSILKGLEGCESILDVDDEKPARVKKPIMHFCVECNTERSHTIQECPALRHKMRFSKCPYCQTTGHILFAKYPGKKELICPLAISKGRHFKY
jgi:hypothetical protein